MTNFCEIPLVQIATCPMNPRKRMVGPKFDDLVASIRAKGIIEPIIVRPVKGKKTAYEIVAGERRFKAAGVAGLAGIPAIVRELTDEEAFELSVIENLQREDLTDLEEAQGFQAYINRRAKDKRDSVTELALRTGKNAKYIRVRVAVLALPKAAVEAWASGKLPFGVLQQLLRVAPAKAEALAKEVLRDRWLTVERLRAQIDDSAVELKAAKFSLAGCELCVQNTTTQKALFDIGEGARCLDANCFRQRQKSAFEKTWAGSALQKKTRAVGFRFLAETDRRGYQKFYQGVPKKCFACASFVSVLHEDGSLVDAHVCVGKTSCYTAALEERETGQAPKGKPKPARKPGEARVPWHGSFFRDVFVYPLLPAAIEKAEIWRKDGAGSDLERLALFALAYSSRTARPEIEKALGLKNYIEDVKLGRAIRTMNASKFGEALRAGLRGVVLEGEPHEGPWSGGFGNDCRALVADWLGIRVDRDFAVTEAYLAKKTRVEVVEFIEQFQIGKDKAFVAYLAKKHDLKPDEVGKLKKGQLTEAVLKSGVDLVGKVPAEILKGGK
jgi:ParB family transcriptional regulator, chromosome partitioning protein